MQFDPANEKDIRAKMVLPAGEYDFEVAEATDAISKSNNEMIALKLRVFCADGTTRQVNDWLLPSMELKLNRFCHAVGLQDAYFAGEINALACEGMSGRLKLTIQEQEKYGVQNSVKDYLPVKTEAPEPVAEKRQGVPAKQTKRAAKAAAVAAESGIPDGDIPF